MSNDFSIHLATARQLLAFTEPGEVRVGVNPDALQQLRNSALALLRIVADSLRPEADEACWLLANNLPAGPENDKYTARGAVYGHPGCTEIIASIPSLSPAAGAAFQAAYDRELAEFNADRD